MPRYWFPKPYADRVAKLRVPFGFLLVAAFAWLSHPTPESLTIGTPVAIAGLFLRAWAAGHLFKNRDLAQSGPYRYTRNPLYIGTVLVACGFVIAGRNLLLAVIFAAVFLLVYLPVIELEEQHLRHLFPAYEGFASRVPRLLPRLGPPAPSTHRFQRSQYLKNREYQALLAFLAGMGWLLIKVRWVR